MEYLKYICALQNKKHDHSTLEVPSKYKFKAFQNFKEFL